MESGAMSDVVKKGELEVKRKNLLVSSSYKKRFVILRNSSSSRGKVVEIWESRNTEKEPDCLLLGDVWSVQDKASTGSKRYAFQLVIGEEVVLTFGCSSFMEREEWTKTFKLFKKMAPPIGRQAPPTSNKGEDFFLVRLVNSPCGPEGPHSGSYLLSIKADSICLHWRTMAIAKLWPRKDVHELSIRSWNIMLRVNREGKSNSSKSSEFEFQTSSATAVDILTRWNMVLMESICRGGSQDLEQEGYSMKLRNSDASEMSVKTSKSFRNRSQTVKERKSPQIPRTGSFSRSFSLSQPALAVEDCKIDTTFQRTSSAGRRLVPAAVSNNRPSTPPPPPPPRRPVFDRYSSDDNDPDYAYIEDSEIEVPKKTKRKGVNSERREAEERPGSPSLDEQLLDIERSMKQEKKEKRKKAAEQRRSATVAHRPSRDKRPALYLDPKVPFAPADPEDYLEPLSAKTPGGRPRSTGDYEMPIPLHTRSRSEPDSSVLNKHRFASQSSNPSDHSSSPRPSPSEDQMTGPTLPPRSWHKPASKGDPDISPYAVVRQILPGKILEEAVGEDTAVREIEILPVLRKSPHNESTSSPPLSSNHAVTETTPPASPPTVLPTQVSPKDPPALPPRTPIKEKLSWGSSNSSVGSCHSHLHLPSNRCSKCQRKKRPSVEKTYSEHHMQSFNSPQNPRLHSTPQGSLPDLKTVSTAPENNLRYSQQHRQLVRRSTESHSSSDGSSNSSLHNSGYLEIVADSGTSLSEQKVVDNDDDDLLTDLQMLDEFMQYFDSQCASLPHSKESSSSPPLKVSMPQNPASFPNLSSLNRSNSQALPRSSEAPVSSNQSPNGYSRRVNGAKVPYQRSQTSKSIGTSPTPQPHPHPSQPIKSMSFSDYSPAPPIPPRSDLSLSQTFRSPFSSTSSPHTPPLTNHTPPTHGRTWGRSPSGGSFGSANSPTSVNLNRTRLSSSGSVHSGSPSPTINPHPRSFRNLATHFSASPETQGSSTVFIHHLKNDRRVMHSHILHSHV